ncbi:MAG: ComEC family competence protein [Flavobacteriaceae bacterium]|nr:ComEC family competence protein [Flavobacteriaceae bacterium]
MLNFTVIKLSLFLMMGIILGFYLKLPMENLLPWESLVLIVFIFSYLRSGKLFFQDILFGISCFMMFILIGIFSTSIHLPQNRPNHYLNLFVEAAPEQNQLLIAEVTEKLKPGLYQEKYILKAKNYNAQPAEGKVLLNVSKDPENRQYEIGDNLALPAEFIQINAPLNPHQFNYRNYMENLGVLRQINSSSNQIVQLRSDNFGLKALAGKLRAKIVFELQQFNFKPEELAIIQALLLGQRQDISPEIYNNYAAAGVIHILAVSGLHVGIILLLLNWVLKPVERLPKGKFIKTLLLLVLLWGFAILAGLSPSVVRAVSMFSFFAIGIQFNRRSSALNTLFISLLFLLLINPDFIFQVGFQLSYAAVLSIVLIQPYLFGLFTPKLKAVKYLWGIFTVTIAAQIGVLPLSLFYFHQFPGLFFISNLVILPFLGIILGLGILVMLLALTGLLPSILASLYGGMISSLNNFVAYVASKEEFIFQNIYFSVLLCVSFYLVILAIIFLFRNANIKNLSFFLLTLICVEAVLIYEKTSGEFEETVVFHKSRNTVIGVKKGQNLVLYHNLDTIASAQTFIRDYGTNLNIRTLEENRLKNVFQLSEKLVLLIDNSGVYDIPGFKPDLIILTNSPKVNLDRIIEKLNPEMIIADGSNYPSYILNWKATGLNKKIPFHATGEKGAFIIDASGYK